MVCSIEVKHSMQKMKYKYVHCIWCGMIDASNVAAEAAVAVDNSSDEQARPWSLRLGSKSEEIANSDEKYHFLLEEEGYVLNRKSMAFLNVITDENYVVRGHGGEPRYRGMIPL